jgi:hypothetical protein
MLFIYQDSTIQSEITKKLKTYLERFLSLLISRPYADSPASLINFERVMQGTRSLAK